MTKTSDKKSQNEKISLIWVVNGEKTKNQRRNE